MITLKKIYSFFKARKTKRFILTGLILLLIPLSFISVYIVKNVYQDYAPLSRPPKVVKGKVVTLKALSEDYYLDYHNMFSNTVRKNLEFPETVTLGYTIAFLQSEMDRIKEGSMTGYCIFDNTDNKLIGWTAIHEKGYDDPGQFTAWINEDYWGGRRFQEAAKLMLRTYFRLQQTVTSIDAHVRLWNKRSYEALKKVGFKDVGYFYENGKATRYVLEYERP